MRSSWEKEGGLTVITVLLLADRQLMPHGDTSPLCQRHGMKYGQTWKIFSKSKHAMEEYYTRWIYWPIVMFFSSFIFSSIVRYSGLGQCCNGLLHLFTATGCKMKLSCPLPIQKQENWPRIGPVMAVNLHQNGVTYTNLTTRTFKLILIDDILSRQERPPPDQIALRIKRNEFHEYKIVFHYHHESVFGRMMFFLYSFTSWAK